MIQEKANIYFSRSYHQKVPDEVPELQAAAGDTYGLVRPEPFEFPPAELKQLWPFVVYQQFDITKAIMPKFEASWRMFCLLSRIFLAELNH